MPKLKAKKDEVIEDLVVPVKESIVEPVQVQPVVAPSELECQLSHQKQLLDLREAMVSNGIDSISKLDVLLGQVNQRVKELS